MLHPAWSPDGRRVTYVSRVGRAEQEIWTVNVDGSDRTRIATGYAPAWSLDGRHLAFVVARVGDAQIYAMNAAGTGLRRLTPSGLNLLPAWSLDGRSIAFLGSRDGALSVYVMGADGSGQRRLAPAAGDLSALPILSWRPGQH
jgi:TolB protein